MNKDQIQFIQKLYTKLEKLQYTYMDENSCSKEEDKIYMDELRQYKKYIKNLFGIEVE